MTLKKILNIFEFYKSIVFIDLIVSTVASIPFGVETGLVVFMSMGFLLSIFIFEIRNKKQSINHFQF